jgi:hypothetical protein
MAEMESDKVRIAAQTLRVNNRFAITGMKFNLPSENFFVREMLNKLEFSFYRNSLSERTTTTESKYAWDIGGNLGLTSNLNLMDKLHLKIGKLLPFGDDYKEAKLYFFFPFMPLAPLFSNSMTIGTSFTRNRGDEKLRTQLRNTPTSRNFNASRNFSMDWKFIENWIVDITGNYSFQAGSDLTYLETYNDSTFTQRPEGQIMNDIFFTSDKLINFGRDLNASQVISINPRFNIPFLKKFLDLTGSYRVQYGWQASPSNTLLGNNVGYNSDLQMSAYLRLNQIFNMFKSDNPESGSENQQQEPGDILKFFKSFVPEQITLNYSQNKNLSNPAVQGRPGFGNFWLAFNSQEDLGPSRFYQLGWTNEPGKRMPFINLQDRETYVNNLTLSTMINPIFPDNLKINLQYKTSWSNNNALSYTTDLFGNLGSPTNVLGIRTITRPSFFISGDIIQNLAKPLPTLSPNERSIQISESFEKDVVSFPFPTWNLSLTGVEKFDLFKDLAQTVSIESAYK